MQTPSRVEVDHGVVVVDDLDRATGDFTEAGFRVVPGGEFPKSIALRNALISFDNLFYLELLTTRTRMLRRASRIASFIGAVKWALRGKSLAVQRISALVGEAQGAGDVSFRVRNGTEPPKVTFAALCDWEMSSANRRTPDGRVAAWDMAFPTNGDLPFLIVDKTDPAIRIPRREMHPNTISMLAEARIRVGDVAETARLYGALLGQTPRQGEDGMIFQCDATRVVIAPRTAGSRRVELTFASSGGSSRSAALDRLSRRYPGLRFGA